MAREYGEYTRRGAQIAAVSVDPPEVNAAMVEKLVLPFSLLSDPEGEQAIKPYGVWHAERGIARPAIVVLAPDGREVFRYVGADFMDRPDDGDVLAALDLLTLPPLPEPSAPIAHLPPRPSPRAFALEALGPYMRGVQMAMGGIAERLRDPWDREQVQRTAAMAARYVKAQAATRALRQRE
ncbi:MAG: hypothetical protein C4290_05865 [Chloroflexota bacterium]